MSDERTPTAEEPQVDKSPDVQGSPVDKTANLQGEEPQPVATDMLIQRLKDRALGEGISAGLCADLNRAADTIDALIAERDAAERECAELRKDAARLDSGELILDERDEFGEPLRRHISGVNLRAAIDAAMEGK